MAKAQAPVLGFQLYQVMRYGALLLAALSVPVLSGDAGMPDAFELVTLLGVTVSFLWTSSLFDGFVVAARADGPEAEGRLGGSLFWVSQLLSLVSAGALLFWDVGGLAAYAVFLFFELGSHHGLIRLLLRGRGLGMVGYGLVAHGGYAVVVVCGMWMGASLEVVFWVAAALAGVRWFGVLAWLWRDLWRADFDGWLRLLGLALPLAAVAFFSQTGVLVDAYLVREHFGDGFAAFRYGSKEFPLVLLLANALSVAQSGLVAGALREGALEGALKRLRADAGRLMHVGFGLSLLLLLLSGPLFDVVLGPRFAGAVPVFDICLLLAIPRLMFPQVVVRGYQRNVVLMGSAAVELGLKVVLSLALLGPLGIPGLLGATVLAFVVEKLLLMGYCRFVLGIRPGLYMPMGAWGAWSALLLAAVLVKHLVL